ncbi:MAG: type III pantothenate kinase [Marinobacterium sp.]|nr:type III pantothenate kinase [Marinobacterium sp.]
MILELDAGNTFIKWRLVDAERRVVQRGRLLTAELKQALARQVLPLLYEPDCARAASVAGGQVNSMLAQWIEQQFSISLVFAETCHHQAGVTNSYENPARMGVDRWMVMLAAWRDCQKACCIVDCGSAITVEYLSDGGQHTGGYIMPGLRLLKRGLLNNTAEVLVDCSVGGFVTTPGTDTSSAVEQGINLMFVALQERLLRDLPDGMPLYITGGDGELFWQLCGRGQWCPELVMDGLQVALPAES